LDNSHCSPGFICGKGTYNPINNLLSFDTFGWSFIMVFYFILNKFRYINLVLLKDGLKFNNIYNLVMIFILGYLILVVFLLEAFLL